MSLLGGFAEMTTDAASVSIITFLQICYPTAHLHSFAAQKKKKKKALPKLHFFTLVLLLVPSSKPSNSFLYHIKMHGYINAKNKQFISTENLQINLTYMTHQSR